MRNGNRLMTSRDGATYVDVQRADGQPIVGNGTMRRPVFIGNGLVAKTVRMNIARTPGIGQLAVFDPALNTPEVPVPQHLVQETIQQAKPSEEVALQTFTRMDRPKIEDVFADFGVIEDDGDEAATEAGEVVETVVVDESDAAAATKLTPFEAAMDRLMKKEASGFELTKEELGALLLTKRQIREIYEGVTGKAPGQIDMGTLKAEIRKYANSSFANFRRALAETERVHRDFPAKT